VYEQANGRVLYAGAPAGQGYSGRWDAKNNPRWEGVKNLGPIPKGQYKISSPFTWNGQEYVMRLTPIGHDAKGRSGFLIHGDSKQRPGDASQGCIILPLEARRTIANNGTGILIVK
jgi:hypothetical protein